MVMGGLEIERKFLVRKKGGEYKKAAFSFSNIKQGYIPAEDATVRIRMRDDKAFLTIKSRSYHDGLTRYEFEIEIPTADALELLKLCKGGFVEKTRYLVRSGKHVFEVDEFHGDNEGLVVAEVELGSEDEPYEKPSFIGPEVTSDRRFRNSVLIPYPYRLWRETMPEEYR